MKLKTLLLSLALLTVPLTPLVLSTSCTTTQQAIAYKSLKATALTVDAAMNAYSDLVVKGLVDLGAQEKVEQLHNKYRAAFKVAVTAAKLDYTQATPSYLAELSNELITTISKLL